MDTTTVAMIEEISKKLDSVMSGLESPPAGRDLQMVGPNDRGGGGGGGGNRFDSTMQEISFKLTGILDPDELLVAIMDAVVALTQAQRGFLMMIEAGNKLRFKVGRNVDQESLGSKDFGASKSVIKKVITTGEPVFMTENAMAQSATVSIVSMGLHSIVCVPLIFGQRIDGEAKVGGVIYVDSQSDTEPLGEKEKDLLLALARQAAVAIENAQLFQKSERDRVQILRLKENITKLYDVGKSISSTLDLNELMYLVMDHVVDISKAERGFLMLLETKKEGQEPDLVFKVGRNSQKVTLDENMFKFSKTIARRTIKEKKAQILTDALGGGDASVSIVQMELQSIMCVPLIEKNNVIGLIYVDSKSTNKEFSEGDLELLESLCGQAAVSLINAKLYKEVGDKERIAHELGLAAKIQQELLPKTIPEVQGIEIYGFMEPALEVGGDYYDFLPHEGTKESVTIVIGDVSGKGVGAGMVMSMARTVVHSVVQQLKVPQSTTPILQNLNTILCTSIKKGMFMTVNILNWWAKQRVLKYTSAGHEHIIFYHAKTKQVEAIKAGGVATAVLKQSNAMMKEKDLKVETGDSIVLYTDGVSECMNEKSEEYELETIVKDVGELGHLGAKDLGEALHKRLLAFRGKAPPHDDITIVTIKVKD